MYIPSFVFDQKTHNVNIHTTRSQSSLSNLSTKSQTIKSTIKEISKNPSEFYLEIGQLTKNKQELEEKILNMLQEMKQLKSISKKLRDKELEKELLIEHIRKEKQEISEYKFKLEKSEKLSLQLLKHCLDNNDEDLTYLSLSINAHLSRSKSKRNSLVIDNLLNQSELSGLRSSITPKKKSPYFSNSSLHLLTSPRSKKKPIKSKGQSRKITPKILNSKPPMMLDLEKILFRVQTLLKKLSKINK